MSVGQGEAFPDFTGTSQDGEQVRLVDYRGDGNLVVFFFPRASTPG